MYRLLRPELVKKNPKPLCPDAFSGFATAKEANSIKEDIAEATFRLCNEIIPSFAT